MVLCAHASLWSRAALLLLLPLVLPLVLRVALPQVGGVLLLASVGGWPAPHMVNASGDEASMATAATALSFVFSAAAIMMVGPATRGLGSLAGTLFVTVFIVAKSKVRAHAQG